MALAACEPDAVPAIKFDQVPPANAGGRDRMETISGVVRGGRPNQRIVLFAKAGVWWLQPFADRPFTVIGRDGKWSTSIHLGTEYGALLVDQGYQPSSQVEELPGIGGGVQAVASVAGRPEPGAPAPPAPKIVSFSGYEWIIFRRKHDRLGSEHAYEAENVSVDSKGFLHLRIIGSPKQWTFSQINLTRSLGYGTYVFTVKNISQLEPAAVLSMYTWTDLALEQNHREMDVNLTRWGDAANRNAEFVLQPYYLPQNVFRFTVPPGRFTYSFSWEPGSISFEAAPGVYRSPEKAGIASHTFNVGVPSAGGENAYLNFCEFKFSHVPLQHESEVVIERFQYLL